MNGPVWGSALTPSINRSSRCSFSVFLVSFVVFLIGSIFVVVPVKGSRPGKNVQLTEGEIRGLCLKSREIFLSQPILLELEAPLKICGEFYLVV